MKLPFINLRVVTITGVCLLAIGGSAYGVWWYHNRPDYLFQSAEESFRQAEKLYQANDGKARAAFETAQTRVELFLTKYPTDPRASQAHLIRYKVLTPLARLVDKDEVANNVDPAQRKAGNLQEQAFKSGEQAAALDSKNVEAQAIMVYKYFRRDEFNNAVPYAQALIDGLSSAKEEPTDLENFNDYVVGAYYVLALRETSRGNPDQVLRLLDASMDREKKAAGPAVASKQLPRWRAAWLEVEAWNRKAQAARKEKQKTAATAADTTMRELLAKYVERARGELKENIPAADHKPEQPLLATLSKTNAAGLIDLLVFSVSVAENHDVVHDRTELTLQVCERMANAADAQPHIYADAARGASQLPRLHVAMPTAMRLNPQEMSELYKHVLAVNDLVIQKTPVDPGPYLEMAHTLEIENQKDSRARALDVLRRGLKVAGDQHLPPQDPRVLSLQAQAAWLLLMDRKVKEADDYLTALAKQQPTMTALVNYLGGLGAILDDRLDDGVQKLTAARVSPRYKDALPLLIGLQYAYLGLGQLENALPVLEQLHDIYRVQEKKNRDDQVWVEQWLPSLTDVTLNLYRCHLTLAQRATKVEEARDHLDKAARFYKDLQKTFRAEDATAALVDFEITRLRRLQAKGDTLQADLARSKLRDLMKDVPPAAKNDPRVLWSEMKIMVLEAEQNPEVMAGAVAAALGAPTDLAVGLGELGRLRAGAAWQWVKAEQRLRQAAAEQKDSMPTQLTWARWLQANGRMQEAVAFLTELEGQARTPDERKQIQASRARLLLSEGRIKDAHEIIEGLRQDAKDPTGDWLYYLEMLASGKRKDALDIAKAGMSRHEQGGLFHFWHGEMSQADGDFAEAVKSYERSIQFVQYKSASQNAILTSLLGMAYGPPGRSEKANPQAAFAECERLRKAHPDDPFILLAYAVSARLLDRVYGPNGMEGALAKLVEVVKRDQPGAGATASISAARQWISAGRPDLARRELKTNADSLPALVMVTELAVADEDWAEVEADLKAIEKLQEKRQTTVVDLALWRAALQEGRGEIDKAKESYQTYVKDNPKSHVGYLALTRLYRQAKDYKQALEWVRKWRADYPNDVLGFSTEVRVMAEAGQAKQAAEMADAFIAAQLKRLAEAQEEWARKNPIMDKDKEKEEAERRAKANAAGADALKLTLTLQTIRALEQGEAFALAEQWLTQRCQPLLDKLPEDTRKHNALAMRGARGTLCLEQGMKLKEESPERARFMNQAIEDYTALWEAAPNADNLAVGNNLAWLLAKEKNDPERAKIIADDLRKGRYSKQPIGAERLPLEFLDTLGEIYHANKLYQDEVKLFEDARQRYPSEPRVRLHLALAQSGLGLKVAADSNFMDAINLADKVLQTTPDPQRKEKMKKVKEDAQAGRKNIGLVGKR